MRLIINRVAIVVVPKTPFFDWARSVGSTQLPDEISEGEFRSVYLAKSKNEDRPTSVLTRNYEAIFVEMLSSWYEDEATWPKRRTLDLFRKWFDAVVVEMAWDLGRDEIECEE